MTAVDTGSCGCKELGEDAGEEEEGCTVSKSRMTVWETGGPQDTGPEATNIGWTVSNSDMAP